MNNQDTKSDARNRALRAVLIYGAMRVALFIALTVIIQALAMLIGAPVPPFMSALLALIVAFPLSMILFASMRREATAAVAEFFRLRRERKQWVRDELASR